MLQQILPAGLFAFLLVFARLGSAFILLPGIGEAFVPPRLRLAMALVVSLLLTPVVAGILPAMPAAAADLIAVVAGEIVIGLFIGTVARVLLSALQTAGMIIALETGLASALVTDPAGQQQGAIAGSFLFVFGVLLIFTTGLYRLTFEAIVDSYAMMAPGAPLLLGDIADTIALAVARSFAIALEISAPFVLVGLVVNLGLGLLARLLPQVQIFFVALPLQLLLGLATLSLGLAGGLLWFLDRYAGGLEQFLFPR
jgi:flagellar biosynthetic protein FliR